MKNRVKKFNQFEVINEGKGTAALRGYPAETVVERIGQMMEIFPDRVKFGVPSDNKGLALTYRDANGAIQKIQDVSHLDHLYQVLYGLFKQYTVNLPISFRSSYLFDSEGR